MGLKPRVEVVTIDTAMDYVGEPIWVVQGERNSLVLSVQLTQAGETIDFEGTEVCFRSRRFDGYIERQIVESPTDLMFVVPELQLIRQGEVACDVTVTDVASGITIKTPLFKLFVLESIQDE